MTWDLRRVRDQDGNVSICEVHYDSEGRPWAMSDARLWDKIWFIRDWLRTPVLDHRKDFTGRGPKMTGIKPLKVGPPACPECGSEVFIFNGLWDCPKCGASNRGAKC